MRARAQWSRRFILSVASNFFAVRKYSWPRARTPAEPFCAIVFAAASARNEVCKSGAIVWGIFIFFFGESLVVRWRCYRNFQCTMWKSKREIFLLKFG